MRLLGVHFDDSHSRRTQFPDHMRGAFSHALAVSSLIAVDCQGVSCLLRFLTARNVIQAATLDTLELTVTPGDPGDALSPFLRLSGQKVKHLKLSTGPSYDFPGACGYSASCTVEL